MRMDSERASDRGGAFAESWGRTCGAARNTARHKHTVRQLNRNRRPGPIFTRASRPWAFASQGTGKSSILRDQLIPKRSFLLIDCVESQFQTIRGAKFV